MTPRSRPADGSHTRQRLDVDERREQLLNVGVELFGSRAYNDVWIEEIAERAGVSRSLLYHYFPTKRDFYFAVIRTQSAQLRDATQPDMSLPPLERLRASMDAYLEYVEHHAVGYLTVHRGGYGSDKEIRAFLEQSGSGQVERLL